MPSMGGAVAGGGVLGDRYEVRGSLGAGPLGEVHRAVDLRLGRAVAVKVVHERLADQPGLREHLDRAVRAAAAVDHPALAAVLDLDVAARPPWLVSALVRGRSLRQVLRDDGPLDPRTAAALTAELCAALAAAHAAGVVHGGLRPGNILLRDGGGVVVTDLGLGAVSGVASAQYLAPEQVLGEEGGVAADLYALGCCLHAMLTGRPPFTGAPRAILAQHAEAPPPAPSAARPGIPLALDRVVLRLLAKRPEDRHPGALAVRTALLAVAEERNGRFPSPGSAAGRSPAPGTATGAPHPHPAPSPPLPAPPAATPGTTASRAATGQQAAAGHHVAGAHPAPPRGQDRDGAAGPPPGGEGLAAGTVARAAGSPHAPAVPPEEGGDGRGRGRAGEPAATADLPPSGRADRGGGAVEVTSSPRRRLVRGADPAELPPGRRTGAAGGGAPGAPADVPSGRAGAAVGGGPGWTREGTGPAGGGGRAARLRAAATRARTTSSPGTGPLGLRTAAAVAGAAVAIVALVVLVALIGRDGGEATMAEAPSPAAPPSPVADLAEAARERIRSAGRTEERGGRADALAAAARLRTAPSVPGLPEPEAVRVIEEAGFAIEAVERRREPLVPEGIVLASLPQPGESVRRDQPFTLVVSTGNRPVTVQDLVAVIDADPVGAGPRAITFRDRLNGLGALQGDARAAEIAELLRIVEAGVPLGEFSPPFADAAIPVLRTTT